MTKLGVNIDHIANVRQARQTKEPDPVQYALLAELGGADGITVHLREDRRHIQDRDVYLLKETIQSKLNLEMASTNEMLKIALQVKPDMVTLVPEKREEITTEGGLDVRKNKETIKKTIDKLKEEEILTSIFIDPDLSQIEYSQTIGAEYIEIHTGSYAESGNSSRELELSKIKESTLTAQEMGIKVNAGHGLTYQNVIPIANIENIVELNIGHTIISRSIAVGLTAAVSEMKILIS
tara:strand:+ start:1532 stop:2242 length:711 start_codon:yes stop_codon:yes gene_type:complete